MRDYKTASSHTVIGRVSISSKSSTGTDQSEEDREEALTGDFQTLGWKAVLLLQFQPEFEVVVMLGIYISYICSVIDVAFAYSTEVGQITYSYSPIGMGFIYYFDVIYAIDIILMIMYKNMKWFEMQHLYDERHAIMVIVDIISTTPLDAMYYSLTEAANMKAIYTMRLRYTFRIFRFMIRINQLKNVVGINHLVVESLDFLINFSLLLVTVSSLLYVLDCRSNCKYKDIPRIMEAFYIMAGKITARGYPVPNEKYLLMYLLYTLTNFFSFLYITGYVVGLFLMAIIQQVKPKFVYKNMQELIIRKMHMSNIKDDVLYSTCFTYFTLFWNNRRGMRFNNFNVNSIPEIMAKEISLDISWDALKHSHLFRDKDVDFLRFVAPYMKQKFMIPGETIYRRNVFKSSMIYVVSGVIQMLSEEDGESPILYFSGGTCIGESTLLLDYPSTCSVVCQSYCEVYVLYRKDFLRILLKYPEEYRLMLNEIKERYQDTMEYQKLLKFTYEKNNQTRERVKLKWLKATLRDLLLKDDDVVTDKHQKTLTVSERRTIREFDRLVFCCNYLDMLVITEQLALITDTVFLQTTCPCVLQPDSFIVATWNNIVVLATFFLAILYPFYASFEPKTSSVYLVYSYMVTFLWSLDIYIGLSTGIKTKEGLIANASKIALYKFQTISFYMDLVAAFPLELFAFLVAGHPGSQTFVLLQLPRLLKIYRLRWFFNESLTGIDVLTRTYLKYTVYMFFLIYYTGALLYLLSCYEFVCDTNNNVFVNFISRVAKGETVYIVILCIYFAAQQLTSFGIKIPAEGSLSSLHIPMIFVELAATFFYVNFLSDAVVTEALQNYSRLKMREYTKNVITVMENLNASPQICNHVLLYIQGQLQYDAGADILYPPNIHKEYIHDTLAKEANSIVYVNGLKKIPIFSGLPYDILADISAVFFTKVLVPGKPVTYAGEVCKEMHIIMEGFCEMFASSNDTPKVIGPGYNLSVVELCCGIPVVNNVVTLTHCKLCSIRLEQFLKTLQMYPEVILELKTTASAVIESFNFEELTDEKSMDIRFRYDRMTLQGSTIPGQFRAFNTFYGSVAFYVILPSFRSFINNLFVIGYSISLAALTISLIIFLTFRSLKCTRIRIHIQLFISFALNNLMWVIWYKEVVANPKVTKENPMWCQALHLIVHYLMVANYMWMFCEGLHLHIALVVVFVRDEVAVRWFFGIGWGISLFLVMVYGIVRNYITADTKFCWMYESYSSWILIVPVCLSLVASLVFLINVLRVILTIMHPNSANPAPTGMRRAARAALILVPLFGLQHVLIPLRPDVHEPHEHLYQYITVFVVSLQGLCVSCLFCFANQDVHQAVKAFVYRKLHTHRWSYHYTGAVDSAGVYVINGNTQSNNLMML